MISIFEQLERETTRHKESIVGLVSTQAMIDTPSNDLMPLSLSDQSCIIAPRSLLESTSLFRQFISYTIVVNKKGHILLYYRKKGGNEKGLHDLYSCGIGGHVDGVEAVYNKDGAIDIDATLDKAIHRELHEELKLDGFSDEIEIHRLKDKFLITNNNPVDSVHLGVVSVIVVNADDVLSGEQDIIDVKGFFPLNDLHSFNLENWSRVLIESLDIKAFIGELLDQTQEV